MRKILTATFVAFAVPDLVSAQEAGVAVLLNPNYFFAVFAGLAMAIGFLFLLASLGTAGGVTVAGNLRKRASSPKSSTEKTSDVSETIHSGIRTVTNGIGAAALVSTTVVLFFACWLAAEISNAPNLLFGAILGLTIWGLAFLLMAVFESVALTSLIGSIMRIASGGMKQASSMVSSLFGKSEEEKLVDVSGRIAKEVREELFQDLDTDSIRKNIQHWVNQLEPKLDPKTLVKELKNLFNETELRAIAESPDALMDRHAIIASLHTEDGFSKEQAEKMADHIQNVFSRIREDYRGGKDKTTATAERVMETASLSKEDMDKLRKKVEDYLRSTGKEELQPENIRRNIEQIFRDPKTGLQNLKSRLGQIDSSAITAVISKRTDMSQDEIKRYMDRVMQVVNTLKSSATDVSAGIQQGRISALRKFREYLNELGRKDTRFEGVQDDFSKLFQDPKAGAEALIGRLKSIDRESLKAMLSARSDISDEDAEHIIQQVESARDQMLSRAQELKQEVERRVEQAKQEALHQAEETRKTVVLASWWVFATLLVSGIAAAIGGIIGVA